VTKQEQIAEFLGRSITLPRAPYGWTGQRWQGYPHLYQGPRPTPDQVAQELLAIPEFRALQLGTWLGTTKGEIIAEAVEMVAPPFYREDVELLVDGLKLAAQLQATEGQEKAGQVALGVICVAAVIALGLSGGESRAA
jgi:hypothetical protein